MSFSSELGPDDRLGPNEPDEAPIVPPTRPSRAAPNADAAATEASTGQQDQPDPQAEHLAQRRQARASELTGGADFGTRFVAWMIDACILFGLQWVVVMVTSRQLQAAGMTQRDSCIPDDPQSLFVCEGPSTALWILLFVLVIGSTLGYHAWFDGVQGASPGKRLMGLRVADDSRSGDSGDPSPIGASRGLLRSIVRQASWVWAFLFLSASPISVNLPAIVWFGLFALSLGPLLWAAFSASGRGWHDLAVESVVTTD